LDIGSSSVKAVELQKSSNGYEITGFARTSLDPDLIVDGAIGDSAAVANAIKVVLSAGKFRAKNVATGVSGHSVIVKRIVLPVDTAEEVGAAIEHNADQYIPFDISDVNLDYHVVGVPSNGDEGLEVLLVAAKKDQIQNTTNVVTLAGRSPSVVDIDAFALQNAFEVNYSPSGNETIALLNIGASLTNINIMKAGMPLFIRDVSVGGNQYTDILQKELQLTFREAEDLKSGQKVGVYDPEMVAPLMDSITDMLTMEVQKTFDFFRETYPDESISKIFLAGGAVRAPGLVDRVSAAFGMDTEVLDPLRSVRIGSGVSFDAAETAPSLAVAIGLALRGFDA
jgi:type IV pilus assembly protein PilM